MTSAARAVDLDALRAVAIPVWLHKGKFYGSRSYLAGLERIPEYRAISLPDFDALLASSRALEAENARLRAALEDLASKSDYMEGCERIRTGIRLEGWIASIEAARRALGAARGEDKAKGGGA